MKPRQGTPEENARYSVKRVAAYSGGVGAKLNAKSLRASEAVVITNGLRKALKDKHVQK